MSKWTLIVDVAQCEGCNNCLLACKDEHVGNDWPGYTGPQPLHGGHWIHIPKRERGQFPLIDVAYRPTPCMHCDEPACARAVPGAVIKRADGIVLIDPEKAKGHKELVASCPYGAIQWNEQLGVAQKCTLCAHLLDDGWAAPRCVQACPTTALTIVKRGGSDAGKVSSANDLEPLHPEFNTKPGVRYANMYRYATCFVTGSVARQVDGIEDCVKGATVHLRRNDVEIANATTDVFGDFRFDRLGLGEQGLSLTIALPGFQDRHLPLNVLSDSINVGTVLMENISR